ATLSHVDFRQANLSKANLNGATLTEACLWETQRSGWSIQGIICEAIYWDSQWQERTSYSLDEFERRHADKNTTTPLPAVGATGMARLFLCHASEDKPQVESIYKRLLALGWQPWMDKMDLLPGQRWQQEIPRVLKESDFILIFFSRHSVAKRGSNSHFGD